MSIPVCFAFWLSGAGVLIGGRVCADDAAETYFQGLLDRELFRVAEDFALHRLKGETLSREGRAELTIQLSRAFAQHATLATDGSSDAIWNEAERAVRSLLESDPQTPRRTELEVRAAEVPAERGAMLRWESEILPEDEALRRRAVDTLRRAISGLSGLLQSIRKSSAGPSASIQQRTELTKRLQFRLAQARVDLGRLLPVGPDRAAAFLDAEALLDELSRGPLSEEVVQDARLLRAAVARLQRDEVKAAALLRGLAVATEVLPAYRDRVTAEQARLLLDQGHPEESLQLLSDRSKEPVPLTSELRSVIIDTLLATWRIAGEKERPDLQPGLLEEAERQLALTGGTWHRWAASRMEQVRESSELGNELAAIIRGGRASFQSGRMEDAASRFAAAAELARQQGLEDKSVELGMMRGSILLQQKQYTDAADGFGEIVRLFPQHKRTAEADLLKCYALGREVDQNSSPEKLEQYRAALQQHVQIFRDSKTSADAIFMLASLQERTGSFVEAWEAYDSVPLDDPRADEALWRMSAIFQQARAKTIAADAAFESAGVVKVLKERIAAFPPAPQKLSVLQARAAVNVAHGLLDSAPPDYQLADELLQRVEQSVRVERREAEVNMQPFPADWVSLEQRAQQLRIVSLAGQQRISEAESVLTQLGESDPQSVLRVLNGLAEMSSGLDELSRQRLGRLQLQVAQTIGRRRQELSADQQRLLDESSAQAFLAVGHIGEAIRVYEGLWKQSPQDRELTQTIADLYVRRGDAKDLDQARKLWSRIEAGEKKGSAPWFDARLRLAEVMLLQRAYADCRKLIGVTKLVYPELGGAQRKQRFEEILGELSRQEK